MTLETLEATSDSVTGAARGGVMRLMRHTGTGGRGIAKRLILLISLASAWALAAADPFRFSTQAQKDQEAEQAAEAQRADSIRQLVSIPCRDRLKNRKILQLVAEHRQGRWLTEQDRYEQLISIVDTRMRALGLSTYTQQQIKASVAQAEVDAYFNNDPDGALAASKRLAADYILRGDITTTTGVNRLVGVNEVAVDVQLTLSSASGRQLSSVDGHSDSYSGLDTLGTATALLKQQADQLVAQLYNDYCRKADR
jgi:hypothetical protein